MKIAIIGYGKMGKTIHGIAEKRGHEIAAIVDQNESDHVDGLSGSEIDVAIEFTQPASAVYNIKSLVRNQIPVVSGTTGWHNHWSDMVQYINDQNGSLFYASNFSIGVNIFFDINQRLAKLMGHQSNYDVMISETHHTEKLDAPSGTAVTLADGMISEHPSIEAWHLGQTKQLGSVPIVAHRIADVFGIHEITYRSSIDEIKIKHSAFSRDGFATGAILAAEWLPGHMGTFGMKDLLNL